MKGVTSDLSVELGLGEGGSPDSLRKASEGGHFSTVLAGRVYLRVAATYIDGGTALLYSAQAASGPASGLALIPGVGLGFR